MLIVNHSWRDSCLAMVYPFDVPTAAVCLIFPSFINRIDLSSVFLFCLCHILALILSLMHKWCILSQLKKAYRFDGAFIQDNSINYSMIFIFLVEFYFIFLILGKALLSNSQICCSDIIHKDLFKIINAFNLFPTCGYFVLFFLIFYITLFVFICFSKGAFFSSKASFMFHLTLYYFSVIILFSVCVVSWFNLFFIFLQYIKLKCLDHITLNLPITASRSLDMKISLFIFYIPF